MRPVDLIPSTRRELHRRRKRVRAWLAAGSIYATLLTGTLAAAAAAWPRNQEGPATALAAVTMENEQQRLRLGQLSTEIAQKQRELVANRAVGNQPDWSVLLALLAEALGDEAALREVELTKEAPIAPPAVTQPSPGASSTAAEGVPAAPPEAAQQGASFSLLVGGIARSQAAVNTVVKRLEETGLFERIELVETRREGVDAGQLTSFKFRCRLSEGRAGL